MRTNLLDPLHHRHQLARRVRNNVYIPPTSRPPRIPKFANTWRPSTQIPVKEDNVADNKPADRQVLHKPVREAERLVRRRLKNQISDIAVAGEAAVKCLKQYIALADEGKSGSRELRARSWRAYAFAKRRAPDLLHMLPPKCWDVLWRSQSVSLQTDRYRRAHVIALYRDMISVGLTPTQNQRVAYLKSLFLNQGEDLALLEWERWHDRSSLYLQGFDGAKLVEIGAWMYSFAGYPERARHILNTLWEAQPKWDPAIAGVVLRAHTSSNSSEHYKAAWELYGEMKDRFGDMMSKLEYDNAFAGFLEARNLRYATQVLGDMVNAGYVANDYSDEAIDEALRKLHMLSPLARDIREATAIGLFAVTTFPRPYHFRIFGEWLKQAVVQNAPQAAAQILDTMYKRGCKPETIHLNLLLKTLFRSKQRGAALKAENIGWHMVDKRFRGFCKDNRPRTAADAVRDYRLRETEDTWRGSLDSSFLQMVPPANATTIALLMKHHADQSQWEHVSYLRRQMKNAGILPNSDIMNVAMGSQRRQGHYNEVWKTYRSMTTSAGNDAQGVFATGATFRCLWKTLRFALGNPATRENNTLPHPRKLLAEMLEWWDAVRARFDADRYLVGLASENHGALNGLVMHCFSYTADLAGSLVAMHALKDRFGIYPSDKAAEILQKQLAWVDMHGDSRNVRFQYSRSGKHETKISHMANIYRLLEENRMKRMKMTPEQYANFNEQELGELKLNCLSEFVRVILKRQHPPKTVEDMINEAKEEIGLLDLTTGDMDAFAVP